MKKDPRIIAFYLPQFHRIPENDLWWGEGFTDWVSTQNAKPLYEGHYQPHVPVNEYYYDLLKKDSLQWQADLLHKYDIDGLCFHHYWFKDGRRILEKPAENLLKWREISLPFCFCWANETWARTWSKIQNKNAWANIYEKECEDQTDGILLEQNYGQEESWKQHFEYLLPFFQDDRYIKVNDCPVFVIYKTAEIPCLTEMLSYWNELALEAGLKGIYIIGASSSSVKRANVKAKLIHQPANALEKLKTEQVRLQNQLYKFDYDEVWNKILEDEPEEKTFFEGFVSFDDTPRRGKEGLVVTGTSPDKFEEYMARLFAKSVVYQNELVFLNAWNEWGEGMHLEPDMQYGEAFLQAVLGAKKKYFEYFEEYKNKKDMYVQDKSIMELQRLADRNTENMFLLDQWMYLREDGKKVSDWLKGKGYKNAAIYGYGILGKHLYKELKKSDIQVGYIIDRQKDKIHVDSKVYDMEDDLPSCDIIIVSVTFYFEEVYTQLREKGIQNIISLASILGEM